MKAPATPLITYDKICFIIETLLEGWVRNFPEEFKVYKKAIERRRSALGCEQAMSEHGTLLQKFMIPRRVYDAMDVAFSIVDENGFRIKQGWMRDKTILRAFANTARIFAVNTSSIPRPDPNDEVNIV